MFDFFKKKAKGDDNVVPFPEPKAVPKVEPPQPKEPNATVFYRLGVTDNNRLAFQMGYTEITMTKLGVEHLIDQLELFKNQLHDEE